MSTTESQARIDAAETFENDFVPALFAEWAPRVADAAGLESGQRVLDVACGTGVLAREAARRVGPSGFVAGLDLDDGMLAVAGTRAPEIEWRQGTADAMPYPDQSFDAVVSQFGLMFFPDREKSIGEMRRVLRPGGRMAVAVWDSLENTPAYAAEVALLERMAGKPSADAIRLPFVLGDPGALHAMFQAAGIDRIMIETHRGRGRFPSIKAMVEADIRGWLPLIGIALSEDLITRILAEAEVELGQYRKPDGTVEFDSPALIVTGVAGGTTA